MLADAAHPAERIGALAHLQPDLLMRTASGTVLGAVWSHHPVHTTVSGLPQHAIALHLGGCTLVEKWRDGRLLGHQSRIGSITLVPAEVSSTWVLAGHSRVAHLYVDPQHLARLSASADGPACGPALHDFFAEPDAALARLLRGLLAHAQAGPLDALAHDEWMALLLRQLLERHALERPLPPQARRVNLTAATLRRVFAHIEQQLASPLRLTDLAGLARLSDDHFLRAFKAAVGQTPHQYLLARRVQRAQQLLAHSALGVAEVAHAVGWAAPATFLQCSASSWGCRPARGGRRAGTDTSAMSAAAPASPPQRRHVHRRRARIGACLCQSPR